MSRQVIGQDRSMDEGPCFLVGAPFQRVWAVPYARRIALLIQGISATLAPPNVVAISRAMGLNEHRNSSPASQPRYATPEWLRTHGDYH